MPENNYNMINPVEGLNNLAAINPASRRKERKKKQTFDKKKNKKRIFEESEDFEKDKFDNKENRDEHRVDFKA
ncbi:MAG: hypothetical protein JW804_06440 [Sedimentisphaerales bacterium]|nr:hypothetical protein [Sedimentisphaerales bacterium]